MRLRKMLHNFNDYQETFAPQKPERNLLLAILSRAVLDYNVKGDIGRNARQWFHRKHRSVQQPEEFSFVWILRELELEDLEKEIIDLAKSGKYYKPN